MNRRPFCRFEDIPPQTGLLAVLIALAAILILTTGAPS